MLLKGELHHRRPPTIPTAGGNLRFQESVRYLGVILHGILKIDHHVTETAIKANRLFHALTRLGGQGWGYQAVNYIVLYKVLFQSICAYAAHGWARRLRQRYQRQLLAAQRQALIRTMKAYATASTDCLPVVAGVLPIDLYIQRRIHRYRISRGLSSVIIRVEYYEDPDGRDNARKLVEEGMVETWQRRWDLSQK